jgi:hypothetical protein
MFKQFRLLLTFYIGFAAPSILVTFSSTYLIFSLGFSALVYLFWFKVITNAIFYFSFNTYKKKEYFYYQNLGLSKQKLWFFNLVVDFLIFILCFSFALNLTNA